MFFANRPSAEVIDRFIQDSQELPLSYAPSGLLLATDIGHDSDEAVVSIGRGKRDLWRARTALMQWKHFDIGWVEAFPRDASVAVGTIVALLVRHFGFWSLNGCRVVYRVGSSDDESRFGFGCGTLTNHLVAGEELFEVFIDDRTDEVMYRIRAAVWPWAKLTGVSQPIIKMFQRRFRRQSAAALTRAIQSDG